MVWVFCWRKEFFMIRWLHNLKDRKNWRILWNWPRELPISKTSRPSGQGNLLRRFCAYWFPFIQLVMEGIIWKGIVGLLRLRRQAFISASAVYMPGAFSRSLLWREWEYLFRKLRGRFLLPSYFLGFPQDFLAVLWSVLARASRDWFLPVSSPPPWWGRHLPFM